MRDHLYGFAEKLSAAFLVDDALVDAPGGDVVGFGSRNIRKAFVVAEVEVGFGAVFGYVALAVFVRIQRAGIDIDVSFWIATRYPRACNRRARDAEIIPLPRDDATPPVTKMYLVFVVLLAAMINLIYFYSAWLFCLSIKSIFSIREAISSLAFVILLFTSRIIPSAFLLFEKKPMLFSSNAMSASSCFILL